MEVGVEEERFVVLLMQSLDLQRMQLIWSPVVVTGRQVENYMICPHQISVWSFE